jgi:hypothetical protein
MKWVFGHGRHETTDRERALASKVVQVRDPRKIYDEEGMVLALVAAGVRPEDVTDEDRWDAIRDHAITLWDPPGIFGALAVWLLLVLCSLTEML